MTIRFEDLGRLGHSLALDPIDYAIQGNAILGIRESGKSYTATCIAEKLMDAKIPIIAFDPIGVWRWLKVGAKGQGYPVVVAGGAAPDLALTPEAAPEIVRAAIREGVSLVIDLFSPQLTKGDWRRIVRAAVQVLFFENPGHGLRHVFIEESAEFVPQLLRSFGTGEGNPALVYAEVERLVRMGRNNGLGCTLINPRAEGLNKEVLELCDMLFLHRQRGRRSLENLRKWLDMIGSQDAKEIQSSLATLPQGQAWILMAGSDQPVRVKIPEKRTYHPNPRELRGEIVETARPAADVSKFVKQLQAQLEEMARAKAAAEQKPPVKQRQVFDPADAQRLADRQEGYELGREEGRQEGYAIGWKAGSAAAFEYASGTVSAGLARMVDGFKAMPMMPLLVGKDYQPHPSSEHQRRGLEAFEAGRGTIPAEPAPDPPPHQRQPPPRAETKPPAPAVAVTKRGNGAVKVPLKSAAKTILPAIVQLGEATWSEISIVAGVRAAGGYWYGGITELRNAGLIVEEGDRVRANLPEAARGAYGAKPGRSQIAQMWAKKLKKPGSAMLDALMRSDEGRLSFAELAEQINVKPFGGYWYGGLSYLRDAGLVTQDDDGIELVPLLKAREL